MDGLGSVCVLKGLGSAGALPLGPVPHNGIYQSMYPVGDEAQGAQGLGREKTSFPRFRNYNSLSRVGLDRSKWNE